MRIHLLDYSVQHFAGGAIPRDTDQTILPATKALDAEVMDQLSKCDPTLQAIFFHGVWLAWTLFGKSFIITGIVDDYGTHATKPCRGIDTDVDENETYGGILPAEQETIAQLIDQSWKYDPRRPRFFCCFYGWRDPSGKHGNHAHWQSCWDARTIYCGSPQIATPNNLGTDPRYEGRRIL